MVLGRERDTKRAFWLCKILTSLEGGRPLRSTRAALLTSLSLQTFDETRTQTQTDTDAHTYTYADTGTGTDAHIESKTHTQTQRCLRAFLQTFDM